MRCVCLLGTAQLLRSWDQIGYFSSHFLFCSDFCAVFAIYCSNCPNPILKNMMSLKRMEDKFNAKPTTSLRWAHAMPERHCALLCFPQKCKHPLCPSEPSPSQLRNVQNWASLAACVSWGIFRASLYPVPLCQ